MHIQSILLLSVTLLFSACSVKKSAKSNKEIITELDQTTGYVNPVVGRSLPDPTVIKASDGNFYLYATEDIRNLPIYKSSNLTDWEFVATAFTNETRPDFEPRGGLWAPDINFINGKFVMYYSMSVWGGEWTCGIGVATADNPSGPFTDQGKLFRSNEIDVQNSIDPFYIEDGGKKYLFWGSFRGIYAIELSDDGLSIKEGAHKQQVAGTAYEGTYIYKKENTYYFFASIGTCCNGVESTYTTVVGKSDNLLGPYLNKNGESMMDNQYEIVISANERFVGTGHNSEIITDDEGSEWLLYHAVDKDNPHGRVLMLDRLTWTDGWPAVKVEGTPGTTLVKKPVFE
nr:family 43 glycosylhydrolase [uncultured Carboxylicivirga sp.]